MKYDETRDDELLKAAFALVGESESFPEAEVEFSAEHEQKMRKLFKTESRRRTAKFFKTNAGRIAAACVAVVLIGGVSVDALRVRVINFVLNTTDRYTEFKFTEEKPTGEIISSYSANGVSFSYIPEGYYLSDEYSNPDGNMFLEFTNGETAIIFERIKATTTLTYRIDTEDAEITEFEENGYHVLKSIKDKVQILTWYNSEYIYTLICHDGEEELIQLAKAIEF